MEYKKEVKKIINDSSLSEKDKQEMNLFVNDFTEKFAKLFVEIIRDYPKELEWFVNIFREKKEAFALLEKDPAKGKLMLQEIYQKEADKLKNI